MNVEFRMLIDRTSSFEIRYSKFNIQNKCVKGL